MSNGVNLVILIGNLGADPVVRYTEFQDVIVNANIATNRKWTDRKTGNKMEDTEWHRLNFYGNIAKIASKYLKKGSTIFVKGRLKTNKWNDKNNNTKYTTSVVVNSLKILNKNNIDEEEKLYDPNKAFNYDF